MLIKIYRLYQLDMSAICRIYEEGMRIRGRAAYPNLPEYEQILRAQEDTYQYLRDEFYNGRDAYYALWQEEDVYLSALRIRKYEDGLLLDALETRPDCRRKGYAKKLLRAVLAELPPETRVYSRILRSNKASVALHLECGFWLLKPYAKFLDGSFRSDADTYLYES